MLNSSKFNDRNFQSNKLPLVRILCKVIVKKCSTVLSTLSQSRMIVTRNYGGAVAANKSSVRK